MAAEAYARLENRIAAVCVTTGPGGTNALTGVLALVGFHLMFIVSGQVRYDTTACYARATEACHCGPWAIRNMTSRRPWHI